MLKKSIRQQCAVSIPATWLLIVVSLCVIFATATNVHATSPGDSLCRCLNNDEIRFWVAADVGIWWLEGYQTPALLTTSPAGTPTAVAGVLGQPTTATLLGEKRMGGGDRFGGRVRAGWWLDPCRNWGAEIEYMGIASDGGDSVFRSGGSPFLARPFFNTDPAVNAPDAQILAMNGLASGTLTTDTSGRVFSLAPTLRKNLCCSQACCGGQQYSHNRDLLFGYRYFRLEESFRSLETLSPTGPLWVPGTTHELFDSFETVNEFHGVEFGLDGLNQHGRWLWGWMAKVAVGQTTSRWTVDGHTRLTVPGVSQDVLPGGFYTTSADIGRFEDRRFAVMPQLRAVVGRTFAKDCDFRVSYDFLFLSSVVRPGDIFDDNIDGRDLAGGAPAGPDSPNPARNSGVWLQGLSFALTWNY